MTFAKFKDFLLNLMRALVAQTNASATAAAAKINQLSADLTIANNLTANLQAMIAAQPAIDQATKDLAAQGGKLLADLDTFSTELATEFNPTPGTDAVISLAKKSGDVTLPPQLESTPEVGTSKPTPVSLSTSAIDAIAAVPIS